VHRYGPHIFHTNAPHVVEYLSRFTEWIPYEHRVLSSVGGRLYPVPINRTTINSLYGLALDEAGIATYLDSVREKREVLRNSEDVVLNSVGRDLCDKFFRNYTRKQWGLDLSELSPGVAGRIPVRTNDDDRYFADNFQKMPADGYTAMFQRMLQHSLIALELNTNFEEVRQSVEAKQVFYSGPIDEYYGFRFGPLPYRSLHFEHEHLSMTQQFQPVGTVNFPNDFKFTRITEFKHLTGQHHSGTSIVREYPQPDGEPYYPIPTPENHALYRKYKLLADAERNIHFIGRLAEYRYYNMDQVVAAALKIGVALA
jgi:UDP-galactopyranose mutase